VIVNASDLRILSTSHSHGKKHDLRLFTESKAMIPNTTIVKADSGYQGIQKLHTNSVIPIKKPKKKPRTKADRRHNRKLSSQRIFVEHVIGKLKFFKIVSDRYRNRRKRFSLRFNLIAGVYNFELGGDF